MKAFLQSILQEIMKKNNTWNIRRLVDDSFVPSSQQPSVNISEIDGFVRVKGSSCTVRKETEQKHLNHIIKLQHFTVVLFILQVVDKQCYLGCGKSIQTKSRKRQCVQNIPLCMLYPFKIHSWWLTKQIIRARLNLLTIGK